MTETCFNYTEPGTAFFSSDERKWINRVRKLEESHPDKVRILAQPEENDGCIYCSLPSSWLRISPPVKRDLTDEQKKQMSDRLAFIRNSR